MLPLEKASASSCGAKAAACARLATLAAGASFKTPAGVCVPFGNMEAAIKDAGKSSDFEALLKKIETAKMDGGELEEACEKLQKLVEGVRPSAAALKQAGEAFSSSATLIARSSANVEDLSGMSGAGEGRYHLSAIISTSFTFFQCRVGIK